MDDPDRPSDAADEQSWHWSFVNDAGNTLALSGSGDTVEFIWSMELQKTQDEGPLSRSFPVISGSFAARDGVLSTEVAPNCEVSLSLSKRQRTATIEDVSGCFEGETVTGTYATTGVVYEAQCQADICKISTFPSGKGTIDVRFRLNRHGNPSDIVTTFEDIALDPFMALPLADSCTLSLALKSETAAVFPNFENKEGCTQGQLADIPELVGERPMVLKLDQYLNPTTAYKRAGEDAVWPIPDSLSR